jgi:phosphoesterase RecJ-like protein
MIAEAEYHNVRAWLEDCRKPLVISHRRPDGDAVGAIAAMTLALRGLGLEPLPTLYEPFPPRYVMLENVLEWRRWDQERDALATECDAVVVLDTCSWSQLGPIADFLPRGPRTLAIDHHPTRDTVASRPGDLGLFDESAGAVCLILAEWMRATGVPVTEEIATALYVGMATDTGWFRFPNTDARMLRVAAELLDAGAPAAAVYQSVYHQDRPERLRLIGRMLQTLELHAADRLAVMMLRQADFQAVGADRSMTEDLVNEAARLGSTEATLLFIEEPDGVVRVNFRSKTTLDVSVLAKQFGGGGHARAAGARPQGSWDDLVPRIIAATTEALAAG